MMFGLIVACEVTFWVLLVAGLCARYAARRPRLGATLLALSPAVDLVLLVAGVLDLRRGATAQSVHALAAVYIGVSVAFGPTVVRWADERFAHRFAGGPPPAARAKTGRPAARREIAMWLRHALAYGVGCGLMMLAIVLVGDPDRTQVFSRLPLIWGAVLAIDLVVSVIVVVKALGHAPSRVGWTGTGEDHPDPDASAARARSTHFGGAP